jgi:hypothetical protein
MDKYDIRNYSDEELKEIVGYTNPNDDLETLIIEQLQKYMYNRSPSGIQMFNFLKNIYTHFFNVYDDEDDEVKTSDEFDYTLDELEDVDFDALEAERMKVSNDQIRNEVPAFDVYDVSKYSDEELYNVLDLNLNSQGKPNDGELEAKLIQMLQLYQNTETEQGKKMFQFYNDIYKHFFDSGEISDEEWTDNPEVEKSEDDQLFQNQTEVKKEDPQETKGNVEYTKELDYTKGKINPILKETYKRTVSIDSQYRDVEYVSATDFTLNFTETLKDVVSMKLYAVQIPVTWYTISNNYGSNYFFLKPINNTTVDPMYNTEAIYNYEDHEYKIEVNPGNYTQVTLAAEIQRKIQDLSNVYTDVNFGETNYTYDANSAMSSFKIEIEKVYNESYYDMEISSNLKDKLGFHKTNISTHGIISSVRTAFTDIVIDGSNNGITIIHYISHTSDTLHKYDPETPETSTVIEEIEITLQEKTYNKSNAGYNELITDTETAIKNHSKISDCKITEFFIENDDSINYYYQWEIQLNRYETQNIANSKLALQFKNRSTDTLIWKLSNNTILSRYTGRIDVKTNSYESTITIEPSTITFKPREYAYGGVYKEGLRSNDIILNINEGTYTQENLLQLINAEIAKNPILSGTVFSINGNNKISVDFNINKIYTTRDYRIIFYDIYSFAKCTNAASSYRNATADTTLGYILGFKELAEYELTQSSLQDGKFLNPDSLKTTGSDYTYTETQNNGTNITNTTITLKGDAVLSVFLYNYFMIVLDDFNQNHLNDGLVTVAKRDTSVTLPSYANRKNYRACDAITGEPATSESISTSFPTNGLTQKQVYSVEQIIAEQNRSRDLVNSGPFIKDMFALLPVKASGATAGTIYVEFGGTLQQQERIYFGPVNIRRIAVKLINDKGDVVDLNGANWSFQLVCEQLYQRGK